MCLLYVLATPSQIIMLPIIETEGAALLRQDLRRSHRLVHRLVHVPRDRAWLIHQLMRCVLHIHCANNRSLTSFVGFQLVDPFNDFSLAP